MVYQKGLTVALRNGIDGSLLEEYNCETTNTRVSVGAIEDIVLCPEITIHGALFDWDKADGLYISVHYGSVSPDITLWVPHPFKGIAMSGRVDWTFQIPGLDVWDRSQSKVVRYLYRFTHAQPWSCGKDDCPNLKKGLLKYLNKICISVKRRSLTGRIAPRDENFENQHSKPIYSISRKQAAASPLPEGIVFNPRPEAFEDIKTSNGRLFNTVFEYRHPNELLKHLTRRFNAQATPSQPGGNRHTSSEDTEEELSDEDDSTQGTPQDSGSDSRAASPSSREEQQGYTSADNAVSRPITSLISSVTTTAEPPGSLRGSLISAVQNSHKKSPSAVKRVQVVGPRSASSDANPTLKKRRHGGDEQDRAARVGYDRSTTREMSEPQLRWPNDRFNSNHSAGERCTSTIPSPKQAARPISPEDPEVLPTTVSLQVGPSVLSNSEAQKACDSPLRLEKELGKSTTPQILRQGSSTRKETSASTAYRVLLADPQGFQLNQRVTEATANNTPSQTPETWQRSVSVSSRTSITNLEGSLDSRRGVFQRTPPSTLDREIQTLKERRQRLQQRLKEKLQAECEQLNRQLRELEEPSQLFEDNVPP